MEWQPIETAPKDGQRLLLWDSYMGCAAFGCYSPTSDDPFESEPYEWAAENYGHDGCDGKIVPSHWMPLPEAPNMELTGAEPALSAERPVERLVRPLTAKKEGKT